MNITLFGGAFNPPHLGHLQIAQQVLDFTPTDQVWLLPNYGQIPPKNDMASAPDRLAMTKMLETKRIKICDLEIVHKLSGDTIELLRFLPLEHAYHFLIGSDWISRMDQWGDWKTLLKKLPFYVFPRQGYSYAPLPSAMIVVSDPLLTVTDISSTKMRERVKRGLPVDTFVPVGIEQYIKEHRLYLPL